MEVMGVIAVIVNCALLGISGQMERYFPDMTPTRVLIVIVVAEVSYWQNVPYKEYLCLNSCAL